LSGAPVLVSVGGMVIENPWGDFPGRMGNSPFLKVSFSVQSFIGFETRQEEQKQEDEKEEEKVRKDKRIQMRQRDENKKKWVMVTSKRTKTIK